MKKIRTILIIILSLFGFSKSSGTFFIHHAPPRIFSTLKVEFNL